ncbi:hypothetical protein [Streptomyces botrytidirepellens]|nr:hypothetical protein [Streptomyces botrytidirepellens]
MRGDSDRRAQPIGSAGFIVARRRRPVAVAAFTQRRRYVDIAVH